MEFHWLYGLPGRDACRFVREKVFVEEQGFSAESEFDAIDGSAWHLCGEEGGQPVAAARLFLDKGSWHAGRICVLPFRRGGVGRELLRELEAKAVSLGARELLVGAQTRVRGFYEACGYTVCGEEYMDEFCPHVPMKKQLSGR